MVKRKGLKKHSILNSIIIVMAVTIIAFYIGLYIGKNTNIDEEINKRQADYDRKMRLLAQI